VSRPLTLISRAIALAAGVGAALAAAAPARPDTRAIVCPLEPNDTITPPCCGPPVATAGFVCCGTPEPITCPVGVTLSSSANPSVAGQKITLSGRWPGNTAGRSVVLWQELPGAKAFAKVATTKTGSFGEFRFVRKGVETNREWYVAVGSDRSPMIEQLVKAVVTLKLTGHTLHGRVTPDHAGERVIFEQHSLSGWRVLARPLLNRDSAYSVAPPGHGEIDFRVVFPGDRRNVRSWASFAVVASY
jgi:hypothetical protein